FQRIAEGRGAGRSMGHLARPADLPGGGLLCGRPAGEAVGAVAAATEQTCALFGGRSPHEGRQALPVAGGDWSRQHACRGLLF
ncbi:hypothetical protein DKP78_23120, partial [Enterococcus faecium]